MPGGLRRNHVRNAEESARGEGEAGSEGARGPSGRRAGVREDRSVA